ncbi:hypothetical protein GCM10011351_01080 [Paraliobacillus quinghaiensis]|uniref:Uncharacterized protein n=1 Tax=Paraliobacillus quinghaiensis TaxID=470815 RepID=A0A917TD12_9BACI|nr:helix-turn-helix domain-containing protein [Paraliobacillus quinghaiensis]GGM19063.1 hypothetical protein GCM10011351_01080 [Paraliobacillus quinghaiensis]
MKQITYLISAVILGVALVISAFIFSNSISGAMSDINSLETSTDSTPEVMTTTQLSEYLQINEQSIEYIIKIDGIEKSKLTSYDTYRFLPYLEIQGQVRFLKEEIDKWLEYKNHNQW